MIEMRLDPGGMSHWALEQLEHRDLSRDELIALARERFVSKLRKIPREVGLLQHVRMAGYNGFKRLYHIMPEGVSALARLRAGETIIVTVAAETLPTKRAGPSVRIFTKEQPA